MTTAARLHRIARPYLAAATFSYAAMSFVFGSVPLLSVITKVFRVQLHGLPEQIHRFYQLELRDPLVRRFIQLIEYLGISVPPWIFDAFTWLFDPIVIYLLVGAAYIRAGYVQLKLDREHIARDRKDFVQRLEKSAIQAGRDPDVLRERVLSSVGRDWRSRIRFIYRNIVGAVRWPYTTVKVFRQLIKGGAETFGRRLLAIVLIMLTSACAGAIFWLMLSYISKLK